MTRGRYFTMGKSTRSLIFWSILTVLMTQVSIAGEPTRLRGYDYPYKNPLLATTTAALLKSSQVHGPGDYVELPILSGRERLPHLGDYGRLGLVFYEQPAPAPLIFLIPGLGGYSLDNGPKWLAQQFYNRGFHVIVLPSAFSWRFAVAASSSGLPGITSDDARDLIRVAEAALNYWHQEGKAEIGRMGLVGYSLGALEAAFVAQELGRAAQSIVLDRVLLINPPADLYESIKLLDGLLSVAVDWSPRKKKAMMNEVVGTVTAYLEKHDIREADYFENLDKKLSLTDAQLRLGVGIVFRRALGQIIFASQEVHDLGLLNSPVNPPRFVERLRETEQFGFMDYYRKFILPIARRQGHPEQAVLGVLRDNSLYAIEGFLRNHDNIFLLHNRDDIFLDEKDMAYLANVFQERATIYPRGGHIGNLWHPQNLKRILGTFGPLFVKGQDGHVAFGKKDRIDG